MRRAFSCSGRGGRAQPYVARLSWLLASAAGCGQLVGLNDDYYERVEAGPSNGGAAGSAGAAGGSAGRSSQKPGASGDSGASGAGGTAPLDDSEAQLGNGGSLSEAGAPDADVNAPDEPCGVLGAACCESGRACRSGLTCERTSGSECVACASLQALGPQFVSAWGISADGSTIVGDSTSLGVTSATLWTETSGAVLLSGLPQNTTDSHARASNDDGTIVVGTALSGDQVSFFRWNAASPNQLLDDASERVLSPGNNPVDEVRGLSGDGLVAVGSAQVQSGSNAFSWGPNGLTLLPPFVAANATNRDGSVLVGSGNEDGNAFRWTTSNPPESILLPPIPGNGAEAFATNSTASVIVGYSSSVPVRWRQDHGFVLETLTPPGVLQDNRAYDTSEDGLVIVGGDAAAFIWTDQEARTLVDLLSSVGVRVEDGWRLLTAATGVSADGRIVAGYGIDSSGANQAFRATLGPRLCEAP